MSGALLPQFLAEARELVQQASDDLLALERDPADSARIDGVFRAFHTLKGSAALFEFGPLTATFHAAEDLLGGLRDRRVAEEVGTAADLCLTVLDSVTRWLDAIEAGGELPPAAGEEAEALIARLRHMAGGEGGAEPAPAGIAARTPSWIAGLTEKERNAIRAISRQDSAAILAITYDPDADCFFHGDDPVGLVRRVPGLAVFRLEEPQDWPPLSEMDVFRCRIRLRAVAVMVSAEAAEVRARFRLLGPQARIDELPAEALSRAAGFPLRPAAGTAFLRAVLEEQRRVLAAGEQSGAQGRAGRIAATARTAANALRFAGDAEAAGRVEAARVEEPALRHAAVDRAIAEALRPRAAEAAAPPHRRGARLVRVEPAKVDRLVSLADEMVLARNALQHLVRRAEDELGGGRDLVRGLKDQHATLQRLAREWHDAAVRMRMVPMEEVFRRFPRLVRDISRQLGKAAGLVIEGERTEADRDLVESLFEPLLHLLRNALDHGIEPPKERLRLGKPEMGRLVLRAFQEADRAVIEVEDDGRGMDTELLRRRAVQRDVIDAERAAALTEAEAVELVFVSGLSTTAEVSDISGRGVGMDAVREVVERAGGTISIRSRSGQGTTVRLLLPLSITLTDILTVSVGEDMFGLPLEAVVESVRLPAAQVQMLRDGATAFSLGERILPLIPLRRVLGLPERERAAPDELLIVVVQADGQQAGLEVDGIGDRLEVVLRPLGGLLAAMREYLGTTLLGSGRVTLVLDVREALR